MSKCSDDLVTDSIPDAPRDPESLRDTSLPCDRDEIKKDTQKTKVECEDSPGQDSSPKARNKSKSTKLPPFIGSNTIPNFLSSGSAGIVCITNAGNVHLGPSLNITYATPTRERSRGKDRSRSPRTPCSQSQQLQESLVSQSMVSLDELDVAAEHVGRHWEALGSLLDFSQGQMERLHDEHRHISLKEVVYQLLLEWRQSKGKDASVGTLCRALWNAEEWDAAERLAKAHIALVSESCQKLINTKSKLKAILKGQKKVIDLFEHMEETRKFSKNVGELDRQVYKFIHEKERNYVYMTVKEVYDIHIAKEYSAYIYTIGIPHFDEIPYLVSCPETTDVPQDIKVPLEVPIDMMSVFPFGECVMIYGRLNQAQELRVMFFREIPKAYVTRYLNVVADRNAVMKYL